MIAIFDRHAKEAQKDVAVTVVQRTIVPHSPMYDAARAAHRAGISVIPIAADGSKRPPLLRWEHYQQRRATLDELKCWFLNTSYGIGFVAGAISGNLELLDFDMHEIYAAWREQMGREGVGALADRIARGYLEQTPNGVHVWYRCRIIERNQPLARIQLDSQKRKSVIETRGEGGLGVVAPSQGSVHPSGKPYVVLQGSIETIQTITVPERLKLFSVARTFNKIPQTEQTTRPSPRVEKQGVGEELPGHIFNQRASWEDVLTPHGWSLLAEHDGEGYWTKNVHTHATTNY